MKTLRVALAALVLVVMLPAAGQSQEAADLDTLLAEFGRPASEAGVSFILVHLNDLTTDALFDVPLKYQLRAQARSATTPLDADASKNVPSPLFRYSRFGPRFVRYRSIQPSLSTSPVATPMP